MMDVDREEKGAKGLTLLMGKERGTSKRNKEVI